MAVEDPNPNIEIFTVILNYVSNWISLFDIEVFAEHG